MNNKTIALSLILSSNVAFGFGFDFGSITEKAVSSFSTDKVSTSSLSSLSESTVSSGLKEALKKGVDFAVKELGSENGYMNNIDVKIPLPEDIKNIESAVRAVGGDKYADDLIAAMNKAASNAAPKTAEVFLNSIDKMTLEDAKNILAGKDDSATQYFKKHTTTELKKVITPIIQNTMKENDVASYYDSINSFYKSNLKDVVGSSEVMGYAKSFGLDSYLPSTSSQNLDEYITTKAMDGLFKMIADKEKAIRENPIEQTTSLLKQVFSK